MALKKSELYSSLWQSCDALRGGMDASQYKDYVLVFLFIKYISDKYAGQKYAPITIPPGASFKDMVALKGKPNIGDRINKEIVAPLVNANKLSDFPDFNDAAKLGTGKELVDRLTDLIAIFENPALDFSKNRADGDDILGDAYEYLRRHFATESGKSKGQFYTPAEVSRVMAQIIGIGQANTNAQTTVYDPTCGSGSLLLKVADEAKTPVTLYGQEKDAATSALARMNMILHDNPTAVVMQGNTLADPKFMDGDVLKTFDFVVANPPFSDKRWGTGLDPLEDPHDRFKAFGVPPAKQGDYAYLLHIVRSMKSTATGACILPHGVLFRGNAEADIRRALVRKGYIKGIIGLPPNLFYGTGIPACIVVIDKRDAVAREGIFMIDASKGFMKDGPKNRLRSQDIHRIVDTFTRLAEVPRYSRMVSFDEISDPKNDYNLNLPRYIDSTEPEDIQDINGHLRGGIPERDVEALDRYWQVMPGLRATLFAPSKHAGYLEVSVPDVKAGIFGHPEFLAIKAQVGERYSAWATANSARLRGFAGSGTDGHPKALIGALSEDLLETFSRTPLIDQYDVYQHLMDYWADVMQDDCYLIAADGWVEAAKPRLIVDGKSKKAKEKPDLVVGKKKYRTELILPALVIARYFSQKQAAIDELESQVAALGQQLEEFAEEHAVEGGLLEDARNDKDKLTKTSVTARLKEVADEADADDERRLLTAYLALCEQESTASSALKAAEDDLATKVLGQYGTLGGDDVKALVVEDKWLARLRADVEGELDRVSQALAGRIRELADRYATALPILADEVEALATRVNEHLRKMGATWI